MAEIDLSQLPKPDVIEELDYETILAARKERFISLYPTTEQAAWRDTLALESEPVTKLLEESAYMELLLRQRINHAARATMLAYATGTDLDNLAANFATQRLTIKPADDTSSPPTPAVLESDENLRKRVQLAFEGVTSAGPVNSYKYHALSADGNVKDVSVTSPTPGKVLLSVLSHDNEGQASLATRNAVHAACNADDVRPLCDTVVVQSASVVKYSINAVITLYPEVTASVTFAASKKAVKEFVERQYRIGRDVTLSGIHRALHQAGVQNVKISQPKTDIVINNVSAAFCESIILLEGGSDE